MATLHANMAREASRPVPAQQQVEALLGAYLAHYDARRAHPQCFLDELTQPDLSSACQACLPSLQRGPVGLRYAQHEAVAATYSLYTLGAIDHHDRTPTKLRRQHWPR
jgi:hypothetical protein